MHGKAHLEEVGLALARGYPSQDTLSVSRELTQVVEVALPLLAQRAAAALAQGKEEPAEIWLAIREDSEQLFAPALERVERVKVIYVASKFANNEHIGDLITRLALDLARNREED